MTVKIYRHVYISKQGFSLVELLVVIAILAVLLGMFLPATRSVREASRRTACSNNLRQVSLAALNFESSHGFFPAAMGDSMLLEKSNSQDANRMSGILLLTTYLEQRLSGAWFDAPLEHNGVSFPAYPSPLDRRYPIWQQHNEYLVCPSTVSDENEGFAEISYAFCIGDSAKNIHAPSFARGTNAAGINVKLQDITDGTSNTIYAAEIGTLNHYTTHSEVAIQSAKVVEKPEFAFELVTSNGKNFPENMPLAKMKRGYNWADGAATSSMVSTILPPNSPSFATSSNELSDGLYSAASQHPGGVNISRADGSIAFVADDIDCGDLGATPIDLQSLTQTNQPSPFGVWGALGSRGGEGTMDE